MKFEDRMNMLYGSDSMKKISDGMELSVPFTSELNGRQADALLLWKVGTDAEIKKLISADKQDASVSELGANELAESYELSRTEFKLPDTEDAEDYYECRDRYEELYCLISNDPALCKEYGEELLKLLIRLFGDDMYENLLKRIAAEYISLLRNENRNSISDSNSNIQTNKNKIKN